MAAFVFTDLLIYCIDLYVCQLFCHASLKCLKAYTADGCSLQYVKLQLTWGNTDSCIV